jgi:hypothetical protein
MKFNAERPYADPEAAARKLIEIANTIEAVQDGRIHIELLNGPYKETADGTITYFGTYSANEADSSIAIHVEGSSFPNWNGTEQKRLVVIAGDQLTLTVRPHRTPALIVARPTGALRRNEARKYGSPDDRPSRSRDD